MKDMPDEVLAGIVHHARTIPMSLKKPGFGMYGLTSPFPTGYDPDKEGCDRLQAGNSECI